MDISRISHGNENSPDTKQKTLVPPDHPAELLQEFIDGLHPGVEQDIAAKFGNALENMHEELDLDEELLALMALENEVNTDDVIEDHYDREHNEREQKEQEQEQEQEEERLFEEQGEEEAIEEKQMLKFRLDEMREKITELEFEAKGKSDSRGGGSGTGEESQEENLAEEEREHREQLQQEWSELVDILDLHNG